MESIQKFLETGYHWRPIDSTGLGFLAVWFLRARIADMLGNSQRARTEFGEPAFKGDLVSVTFRNKDPFYSF